MTAATPTTEKALQQPRRVDPMREIGTTGLEVYSGEIDEEFLPQLAGDRAIKTFREMTENDATVGALLFVIGMLVRQVEWRIEAGGDSPADLEAQAFVESCLEDMSETWPDTIASILSFLPYGFSVHEEVYKRRMGASRDPRLASRFDDGRIGWRKLPIRAQDTIERWIFDPESGELQGAVQVALPSYNERILPAERFLLFRTTSTKGNPEGRSILRSAYRAWWFKKRIEEIEGIGIERDLAGLPVIHVPPELLANNASATDKALLAQMKKLARNIRRDEKEGVIFPMAIDEDGHQLYKLELLTTGGRRQFDTGLIVQRYDKRIAMVVAADFILLGQDKVGSFALASSKTNIFATAIGAWLDSIVAQFNRFGIPRLFSLNSFAIDQLPQLIHGDIEDVDLTELGEYISKLSGAGVALFPNRELENYLLERARLPIMEEAEEEEEARPAEEGAGGEEEEEAEEGVIPPKEEEGAEGAGG
jgi:hypothetical protein